MQNPLSARLDARLGEAVRLLEELIAIPSLSGEEQGAAACVERALEGIGIVPERAKIPASIRDDPDYSCPELNLSYEGRHNVFARVKGTGAEGGRSAIVQTHLDVVPGGDWARAFDPETREGVVYGRGACDCKGQAVVLWLALASLKDAGIRLKGDALGQFVVEEEIGGNGALAAVLGGDRADCALILEPTEGQIHPANRGACWFRITLEGRPVHMGRKHEGISSFEMAVEVNRLLMEYERELISASANVPQFERYERPVQVNVGMVHAGDWPSMVPATCVMEGGIGFLPNRTMRSIQEDVARLLATHPDAWLREHHRLEFPKLHNDAYACDPNHSSALAMLAAAIAAGIPAEVFGWNVSCDARLYAHRGGMQTMVFGPGLVSVAHSEREHLAISDLRRGAEAVARFLMEWCGVA
jgi:acetylornithine deacetylase